MLFVIMIAICAAIWFASFEIIHAYKPTAMQSTDRPSGFYINPNPGGGYVPAFLYDADTAQPGYDGIPVCSNNVSPPTSDTGMTPYETFWFPNSPVANAFCYWNFGLNRAYTGTYYPVPSVFGCVSSSLPILGTYYWWPTSTNLDFDTINRFTRFQTSITSIAPKVDGNLGIAYQDPNWQSNAYGYVCYNSFGANNPTQPPYPGTMSAWITHSSLPNQGWSLVSVSPVSCGITTDRDPSGAGYPYAILSIDIASHFQITQSRYQSSLLVFCPTQWYSAGNCVAPIMQPTVCSLDCRRKPNQDCNLAGTKCICKKPYWPIFDNTGVTITSCYLPNTISTRTDGHDTSNIFNSRSYNRQGTCVIDRQNPSLSFCRNISANYYQDVCFGHGYALLQQASYSVNSGFNFGNGPIYYTYYYNVAKSYDCWCDAGWSGSRCHIPCVRASIYDVCGVYAPGNSDSRLSSGYSAGLGNLALVDDTGSYFAPADPALSYVTLNLWNKVWVPGTDAVNTGFDAQWYRIANGYYGSGEAYAQARCWINPSVVALAYYYARPDTTTKYNYLNNTVPAICELSTHNSATTGRRQYGLLNLQYWYLDSSNINCGTPTSNRNSILNSNFGSWDTSKNPCPIASDPRPTAAAPYILNTNDASMSSNIFWTYTNLNQENGPVPVSPVVSCADQNQWNSNGVCTPCNPVCDTTYAFCNFYGTCQCQRDAYYNSTLSACVPKFCPYGYYGVLCDQTCQGCGTQAKCDDNIYGSGKCLCNDATQIFVPSLLTCTAVSCGPNNACSNNGICITGSLYSYCSCNRGWDGQYCQNSRLALGYVNQANHVAFDECDCSVLWAYQGSVDSVNKLPTGYAVLTDYSTSYVPLNKSVIGTGYVVVGNVDQAKHLCYKDAMCSGFIIYSIPNYWLATNQATTDANNNVYQAVFLMQTGSTTASTVTYPLTQRTTFYTIDRYSLYPCNSYSLDLVNWYRNQYFSSVQTYCTSLIGAWNLKNPQLPKNAAINCYLDDAFISHWRYVGHLARLSPNQQCSLTPTIQDPASYCSASRCPRGLGDLPCSGNGFCLPNTAVNATSAYQCVCKTFYQDNDVGLLSLNNLPAWQGSSCQYSVAYFCVSPGTSTLCSDTPNACQFAPVASGNFFADQFQNQLSATEVIPQCICDGTSKTGQYCQNSKCGATSGGCKSLSAAAGDCVLTNNSTYSCLCQRGAIGQYCEIDATGCLYNDLKCSSQGTCLVTNNDATQPTHCSCNPGFSGQFCQDSACDVATMVPGHGMCVNNQVDHCYGPYSGARCEVDICAAYNGTVQLDSNNLPTQCKCPSPLANKYNGDTAPTCWPQCPIYQKQMCGPTPVGIQHGCVQRQNADGTRTAKCQCANGYISVPNPLNPSQMICEKYCFQGTTPVGWTPDNPSPCICSPSSGYDTAQNHPRCDRAICAHNGTYSVDTKTCQCYPPWIGVSSCQAHSCGKTGAVVPWYSQTSQSPYQCQCANPTAPSNPSAPFDCNGNRCGAFGALNPYWTTMTNPQRYCICQGKAKTTCDLNGNCNYCQNLQCQNGGSVVNGDFPVCNCVFPFVNGPLATCDANACNANNTLNATVFGCICKTGYSGSRCEQSFCQNGGAYNTTSGTCQCPFLVYGFYCEVSAIDVFANIEIQKAFQAFLLLNHSTNTSSTGIPYYIDSSTALAVMPNSTTGVASSANINNTTNKTVLASLICLISILFLIFCA